MTPRLISKDRVLEIAREAGLSEVADGNHIALYIAAALEAELLARVAELMGRNEVLEAAGDAKSELTRKAISQLATANAIIKQARRALYTVVTGYEELDFDLQSASREAKTVLTTITEYQKGRLAS